jgi:hypothetical protein
MALFRIKTNVQLTISHFDWSCFLVLSSAPSWATTTLAEAEWIRPAEDVVFDKLTEFQSEEQQEERLL